jgi:hypothetical protein
MPATELAAALTAALGAEVRVEGEADRRATLDLADAPAVAALDRAAAALGGRWQPVVRVSAGATPADRNGGPGNRIRLGRNVTLRLRGTGIGPALAAVARAAGARLEASPGLKGSVFLEAQDLSVEEALDRVTAQAEARWRLAILLIPGPIPPPPPEETKQAPPTPQSPPVSLTPAPSPRSVTPLASRGGPTPALLRQLLTVDLARLLQTPPGTRAVAVNRYATRLERAFDALEPLPVAERTRRLMPFRGLFRSGLRAFGGLTPDQQRDFLPVERLLRRWMP